MDTNTKNEIGFLARPLGILVTVVILFIVVLSYGLKQINTIRSKNEVAIKNETVLRQKAATLETVEEILPGDVTFLDVVLPSKGAVLYGLSQVKSQAATLGVALSSLKTGISIPEKDNIFKTSISFEAEGPEQSIYLFLESFSKVLPLMNVDKVSLNKSGDLARASVTLSVFSSDLPKKIPALNDPIKELTTQEIAIIKELALYQLPQFIEPTATEVSGKTDPFNQQGQQQVSVPTESLEEEEASVEENLNVVETNEETLN